MGRSKLSWLLDTLIDRLAHLNALLLVSFRPEFAAPWVGRAGVSLLALSRLDHRQSTALAVQVALKRDLPASLLDRIAVQTDGVPLFIEELTKAVLDSAMQPENTVLSVPDAARQLVSSSLLFALAVVARALLTIGDDARCREIERSEAFSSPLPVDYRAPSSAAR